MKSSVTRKIEITLCDGCGKEAGKWDFFVKCLRCKREFCRECAASKVIEYKSGVYSSGSDDGNYCLSCERQAVIERDPLVLSYREINALRDESKSYSTIFRARVDKAEGVIRELRGGKS